jgi:GntR family transcriptional repressor for pyruvate dehydrogenase complex
MENAIDDVEESSRLDLEFHRGIARATHNPLYLVLLDSVGDVLLEIRRATLGTPGRPLKGVHAHRLIVEAIEGGDVEWARDAMRAHLEDSAREWERLEAR